MRRFTKYLILSALLVGCDSAAEPTDVVTNPPVARPPSPRRDRRHRGDRALAVATLGPNTLVPVPPPGAVCHAGGPQVICHTAILDMPVNAPDDDLPCGTLYITGIDDGRGIR